MAINSKNPSVFTEQTLVPVSLVITIVTGVLAIASIYYKAEQVEKRQNAVESIFEREKDRVFLELKELREKQIEMDKKIDAVLRNQARNR
jgi:hypothetical protein